MNDLCKTCFRNRCPEGEDHCAECRSRRAEGARLKREKIERLNREGK